MHLFAFDLLYLNGEVRVLALSLPLSSRGPRCSAGKSTSSRVSPRSLCVQSTELTISARAHPQALLEKNLRERRALLREHLQAVDGEFAFAQSEDASTVDEIQAFLDRSIKDGCEGLMVKMLEGEGASYEPSRRSIHWLKVRWLAKRSRAALDTPSHSRADPVLIRGHPTQLKKDYLQGVGDSFDLVVIGGDYGKGKRTNVYGAFTSLATTPTAERTR